MTSLESRTIATPRLKTHVWVAGSPDKPAVLLLHGNASSAVFFDRVQADLGADHFVVAPDMRGYGKSETKPVDATRGVRDFSDDLAQLLASPELGLAAGAAVHVVGWSAGGNVAMQLALDHGERVASLTLINPGSPYGYGATKGLDGEPCYSDYAGCGGGLGNPTFIAMIEANDTSADDPSAPRNVMNTFYWKPPFRPESEELYLSGLLDTATGPGNYPGDSTTSDNWPGLAPGVTGMNNALSPKYLNQAGIVELADKPPILWVRGADDQIVSDRSMFDVAVLGEFGVFPGWPGAEVFPAQPMVSQTRAVFDRYREAGGRCEEVVFEDCGHGPHIEKHDQFMDTLRGFLSARG